MAAQTWNVDPSHSSVGFSVRHMMIARVHGKFTRFTASAVFDEADPSKSHIEAKIEAASVDTADAKRDEHLRSADFFDVQKFPELVFRSTKVEGHGDDFKVLGELTIHGVTRPVELKVTREGGGKDPWGNERMAFTARTHVNRSDYGLKWNVALESGGVLVSDKVDVEIDISAVKAK